MTDLSGGREGDLIVCEVVERRKLLARLEERRPIGRERRSRERKIRVTLLREHSRSEWASFLDGQFS
jgi:hypothetical protein